MSEKKLIDDAFYIVKKSYGLWDSSDKDGKGLITSFTEESCINATRAYLKWLQEGFPEIKSYTGKVDGKL
jgi:hypothetical protein